MALKKDFMTRKVTVLCFHKRLLLHPYKYLLFSDHPRTHPHIFRQKHFS